MGACLVISSPSRGMAAAMTHFGTPETAGAGTVGVSVPGRAAAGAQHSLTMHRLPGAPAAPHPAGLGGRK